MNVGYLKELIKDLPDDMEIFVGCQGYSNFDFCKNKSWADSDTFAIVHDGKLLLLMNVRLKMEREIQFRRWRYWK